jgi:hypothetical protein
MVPNKKAEFFNRIGRMPTFADLQNRLCGSLKADLPASRSILNAQTANELPYHPKWVISLTVFAATSIVPKMPKFRHFHAIIEFDTSYS